MTTPQNENIKRIATENLTKVIDGKQIDMSNLESLIDSYVFELIRATVFEASNVIREKAKHEKDPAIQSILKVVTIDLLDHFGL